MSLLTHVEISASLLESVKKTLEESNEYQKKVQAHMAKKGIKSLNDLTDDQKKKFFNELDAMHKAKNEEVEAVEEGTGVTDYAPKSQGGTRKELLAKYHKSKNPKDAEAARKAGATQKELQGEEVEAVEESFSDAQISQLRGEMSKVSGIDPASPTYKKLVDMLNNMGMKELTKLADANIKFISGLARNRVIRAGMKKEEVELENGEGVMEGSKHASRPRSASRPGTEPAKKGSIQDRIMAARQRMDAKKKANEEVELEESPYMGKGNHRPGWMLRADPELAKKFKEKEDAAKNRKKYMGKTSDEIAKMKKEEVELDEEQLDELSKKTLGKYVKAAAKDAEDAGKDQEHYGHKNDYARGEKRQKGIAKAVDKLTKEEVELDEEQLNELDKSTLASYIKKRSNDVATMGAMTRKHAMDSETAKKDQNYKQARKSDEMSNKAFAKGWKHRQNIAKAVDKLTKEELEFIESLNTKESSDE